MKQDKKWPFMQWWVDTWLGDPKVSMCEPATRGILFDWLCNMHLLDRCGKISGTREQLARAGRCSAVQCDAALLDLKNTNAADVTERNGIVTVTNRRMNREYSSRKNGSERVTRHRCNGDVTPHNQSQDNQSTELQPDRTRPINRTGEAGGDGNGVPGGMIDVMALDRLAGEIMDNRWGWFYDNCKVKLVDFTRASLMTVLRPYVGRVTEKVVERAWKEAVTRAHRAVVDEMVRTSAAGYCVKCFRELMDKEAA